MNAVIYARYSSDNQREESIEGQLRECKEYADQNGITVVRTYIDRALSAKTDSRPQFQQMVHDSATHTFEAVLVWKLDRFSRNRYDSAHYKRILKNNRVHVVSVTEPISNTPEGIMLESLLEGMAEYYSAELAEKVSRGHKENALKAKFNGGPVPLGYRIDSEHHYQIDPATAPVVQEAFQRYAAGESIRSIIESLNARGTRKRSGKEACSLKPVRKEPLEQFVVQTALEKVLNDRVIDLLADKLLEYQSKENTRLPVLQAELKEVKRRIDNLVAAIEQGILTPSTKARMEELEQQREALETNILQEQIEKPPITREQILFWFDQFRHGDPADIAFQEKVIDCFVNSIYLFDDRIVVNFNYQEGGRPVSLEEVLSSFLDGNGAPKNAATNVAVLFLCIIPFGAGSCVAQALAFTSRGPVAKNAPQERFLNAPADGAPKKCLAEKQGIFLLRNIAEMRNSVQTGTRTARPAAMRPGRGQQSSGLLESARESPRGAPKNAATNVAVFFYAPSPPGRLRASLCGSHSPRGDRSLKTFHRSVFLTLLLFGKAKWRKRYTGGVAPVRPDVVEIEKERLTCR